MKKFLLAGILLWIGVFIARDAFTATYDASGSWTATTYNSVVEGDCTLEDETTTVTISQSGDSFQLIMDDGESFSGTVNGATYTISQSTTSEGTTQTVTIIFTLSSSTSGSGTAAWSWASGTSSCNASQSFTLTKQTGGSTSGSSDGDSGDSGGGCFIGASAYGPQM